MARPAIGTTDWESFGLLVDTDGLSDYQDLKRPEKPSTWARANPSQAVLFRAGSDPHYEYLARMVLASAAVEARQVGPNMALICRRARRWLRTDTPDLRFWCDRAGVEIGNLLLWARTQFPRHDDPRPPAGWMPRIRATGRRAAQDRLLHKPLRRPKSHPPLPAKTGKRLVRCHH